MKDTILLPLDTETTALEPPIHIVEVAWQELDHDLNELSNPFCTFVNPGVPIPEAATSKNNIYDHMVVDAPPIEDIMFPDKKVILICHNIKYDRPLVEPWIEDCGGEIVGGMCTMLLARRLLPDADNHQLQTLLVHCDLPESRAHRADGDVETLVALLKYMLEGTGWTFQQMYEFSQQKHIFKYMPIGKHKGKPCGDVPTGYWSWILKAGDFDRDMLETAKYWLGRK